MEELADVPADLEDGSTVALAGVEGAALGCGIFDRTDPVAAWRRFSWAEDAHFDENYLAGAVNDSLQRRGGEACQRLVSTDADFLPGLKVDLFHDVAVLRLESLALCRMEALVVEMLREALPLSELVIHDIDGLRTASGNNLKPRWIEVEDLHYRMDFLSPEKPVFALEQREQHVLFGSLCAGRRVLDTFAHDGAFGLQAMRYGAESVVAVDENETYAKAIGANAQKNKLRVEAVAQSVGSYLSSQAAASFDAVVIDPPAEANLDQAALYEAAFRSLTSGGVFATYSRALGPGSKDLLDQVARAASAAGREARVFARTAQPFDFPRLLNFSESQIIEGLILEVM